MKVDTRKIVAPSIPLLRWLVDPGKDVPAEVRGLLLSRLISDPAAIIMGVINSILVSGVALAMHGGRIYTAFIVMDVLLGGARLTTIRRYKRALTSGRRASMDTYLVSGMLWCLLQGAIALTNMDSANEVLKILSTVMIFGVIGPLCARNYPAPRYCMLLVMLCDLQFVLGCVLTGNHWLAITVPQTPPFLLGTRAAIRVFQRLAIDTLKAEAESRDRAVHDPLTGLLNRRGFQEAIAHHERQDTQRLGVLALDLDGFKQVNDKLGHHVGDLLLQAVAQRLAGRVRPDDSVVRLGGDEFAVLMNNVTLAEAGRLADRIIEEIGNVPYRIDGGPVVRVGVSIGIACAPEDGIGAAQLHRRADLALYEAKAAGRGVWRRFAAVMERENARAP